MKILHLEISSCHDCPHADQDEDGVHCLGGDRMETLLTSKELYEGKSVKEKFGTPFPAFCPLPNKE
jgi:hypothetical protein